MEPVQRVFLSNNWMTITFVVALIFLVVLKTINPSKLKGYAFAIFNKGFVEVETEKSVPIFSFFKSILFLFSSLILSVAVFILMQKNIDIKTSNVILFLQIFISLTIYLLVKRLLEYSIGLLFEINNGLKYFIFSKYSSLYSASFAVFILVVMHTYSFLNTVGLLILLCLLTVLRFVVILINNKKLILSELFYFILYLCAFEIAPLFILFKWLF